MRWFSLITGIILCGVGALLFSIELVKQPAYLTDEQLNVGYSVNKNDLLEIINRQEALFSWGWKDADSLKIISLIEYALATSSGSDESLLHSSIEHLSEGLALSPADPFAWLRLVDLRLRAAASPEDIVQALHMAVITGPVVTQLIAPRLRLALIYWDYLGEDDRQLFMTQIKMLKQRTPEEATRLASMNDRNQKLFSTPGY